MAESKFGPAAFSEGNIMRRMRRLEAEVAQLRTARNLESALIGAGGLRIRGGQLTIQDIDGDDMFRAGGDPGELFIREDLISPLVEQIVQELLVSPAGQELAAFVFAQRVHSAYIGTQQALGDTGGSYVSLAGGPSLSDVDVSEAGTMLIFIDTRIQVGVFDLGESTGEVSPQITGASTVGPGALDRKELALLRGTNDFQTDVQTRSSTLFIATGLNAGTHSIEAQYRAQVSGGGNDVLFDSRGIAVIAL